MMSEYYDHYHRWEPLAEFHFIIDSDEDLYDDNYVYCLCSRAFIRDGVKTYYAEKEDASESDVEVLKESQSQELEDQSHVHFSLDTSYKVKCEKDEGASCYCSASHTDNYCSTDEHDAANHANISHALQPSDSGADLTYPDSHLDYTNHDPLEKMDQDLPNQALETNEDYQCEDTWDKFWAVNGERLIWASWIKKYSDYINPAYLDENNDLTMDDNNVPKGRIAGDPTTNLTETNLNENIVDELDSIRERKFSYDSKVNPYKKNRSNQSTLEKTDKSNELTCNKDDLWVPIGRRRSCSEHDRMLSPRTLATTDSMTNVTKITLSSYDVNSSHVTSESSPTDDYSVSSSTSDDPSNDKTRIANILDETLDQAPSEEQDPEQYWQFLWKKHFGEQFALHYANYIECHEEKSEVPVINIEPVVEINMEVKAEDIECETSEGNSQDMPSVIEVQTEIEELKIEEKKTKPRKRNKKTSNRYAGSVGVLLQNLLKEEQKKNESYELTEAGEIDKDKTEPTTEEVINDSTTLPTVQQSVSNSNFSSYSFNDGDDDPPEDKPTITLKRSHEFDEEEVADKIKNTFETMGFCLHSDSMPKGQIIYRKRNARLRPPRSKKFGVSRKTYFDDDGNPLHVDQGQYSQEEREMQTDDDCPIPVVKADADETHVTEVSDTNLVSKYKDYDVQNKTKPDNNDYVKDVTLEASAVPLPPDVDTTFSDVQENEDSEPKACEDVISGSTTKRRRRPKRKVDYDGLDISDMPAELQGEPKMIKYWKKRHSLFHRFDEGIKLDRESWFSVTPENVAWHIANKVVYDVVLDAFCGAGGNTIQFARTCKKVIAIDIDPAKIEMARQNATIYGVADKIQFIVGDFFELAPTLHADMVFLSPPWGGPNYSKNCQYDIETMLEPKPASELMSVARTINSNVSLYLPRNSRSDQILALAQDVGGSVEVEQSYLDKRFVAITAYFY